MNASSLKEIIKSGNIGGAFIFCGEEDYLKKYYLSELAKIACPDEGFAVFNRVVFDGEEIDFSALREAISAPPMFSDYKLVEWRYPDLDGMSESERKRLEELSEYIKSYPYCTLVIFTSEEGFDAGSVKRPSKLALRLDKLFSLINFEKSTDAQLLGWLKKHFDAEGVGVSREALSGIIFRCGHSMQTLKNELDKLCAFAKANSLSSVGPAEVESVTSATLECDAFALSSAITDKNRERAFIALMDMKTRRIEPGAVMAMTVRAFSELATVAMLLEEGKGAADIEAALKWNAYKIKICINSARAWGAKRLCDAVARLKELDAGSKSGGSTGLLPIEIFISEFL